MTGARAQLGTESRADHSRNCGRADLPSLRAVASSSSPDPLPCIMATRKVSLCGGLGYLACVLFQASAVAAGSGLLSPSRLSGDIAGGSAG